MSLLLANQGKAGYFSLNYGRYSGTRYSVRGKYVKGQVLIAGAEQAVRSCGAVGCVLPPRLQRGEGGVGEQLPVGV